MTGSTHNLLLHGIFQRLRAAGLSLGIRDFLDGVDALHLYPEPFQALAGVQAEREDTSNVFRKHEKPVHRIRQRNELVWLLQTLWARTPEERRIVYNVVTLDIGLPSTKLILDFRDQVLETPGSPEDELRPEPLPKSPFTEQTNTDDPETVTENQEAGSATSNASDNKETELQEAPKPTPETIKADVVVNEDCDVTLPKLQYEPNTDNYSYSMLEDPVISSRWLLTLWRRMFRPVLEPDDREIDLVETVKSIAETGLLLHPVMKQSRVNTAKLLVLIDVSEAMAPWRSFETAFVESLDTRLSRLGKVNISYFNGVPGKTVYQHRARREPQALKKLLNKFTGSPMLIIGEAGAARLQWKPIMAERMGNMLNQVNNSGISSVVWINPMTMQRWNGSYMDLLRGHQHVHCIELNTESLLKGIDIMRGMKA